MKTQVFNKTKQRLQVSAAVEKRITANSNGSSMVRCRNTKTHLFNPSDAKCSKKYSRQKFPKIFMGIQEILKQVKTFLKTSTISKTTIYTPIALDLLKMVNFFYI
jgi:hypothetical protein